MKVKFAFLVMVIALITGFVLLSPSSPPPPTIKFVGFKEREWQRRAVFCITNSSRENFSFTGYGTNDPLYLQAWCSNSVWFKQNPFWCGTGSGMRVIPPNASFQFEVNPPEEARTTFRIGVYFEQGTPEEIDRRYTSRFARAMRWLRHVTKWKMNENSGEGITWSEEVQI